MDDMISRQAAIETVRKAKSIGQAHRMLVQLPSAQPGWIPTSERLPKPNEYENNVRQYYLVQNEYGDMMICSWHGNYWIQMYRNTQVEEKVVAWMPLPTQYREGGQDE